MTALPEWPREPDVSFMGTPHHRVFVEYWRSRSNFWESRARLAVEALRGIENNDLNDIVMGRNYLEQVARDTLKAIGPLPEDTHEAP